jgi:5'-nucleotidase
MRRVWAMLSGALALAGCVSTGDRVSARGGAPVEITLIAFNDFHGNLEPPQRTITLPAEGALPEVRVPAGGAAYFAGAIEAIRARSPNHLVVSAGDLVSASPLTSSLFLDEPTILAMNMAGLDFNAVGNHEFDRGRAELLRLDRGGCDKHTQRQPCALDPAFPGANFPILAANVVTETGDTLLPAYGMRRFGRGRRQVDVAVIGMTLRGTPSLVAPAGIAGLTFRDEAETVNALIPRLKAEGAELIVLLIHQGLDTRARGGNACERVEGDLVEVLQRLSPEVDVVVSGHTHNDYVCDFATVDPQRPFLVTSAGSYGTMLSEIRLRVDPRTGAVVSRNAVNRIVQGEGFRDTRGEFRVSDRVPVSPPNPAVAALVARYAAAAAPLRARPVGRLTGPALREATASGESSLGNLVADAQLAAMRAQGAEISLMNPGGLRADLVPAADGSVSYGQIYAVQPFGNVLLVRSFTGRQLRDVLEQQWASGSNTVRTPQILLVSRGFTYSFDTSRPAGQRVTDMRLGGVSIRDDQVVRVTMSNFLAFGGDNFTALAAGTDEVGGPLDLDALEGYMAANPNLAPPATDRIRNLTPQR